jgi:membrane fusion protein, multidrug efflux system
MVLLVLMICAGGVLGRLLWRGLQGREVTLQAVSRGRVVAAVYATGVVDTDRRATVRARVTAPLATLLVGPGQAVTIGQVVGRQDTAALRLARERTALEADATRAALAQAEDAAERAEKLVREQLVPEDAWVRARENARQARAELQARESSLALTHEQETWAELRSPLDGAVSSLSRRAGDALREGDDVLTVVDLTSAYVRVAVDERDLGRVVAGQEVRLVFDAYPDRVLLGKVSRVVPAVNRLTKSSDVLVELPVERPALQLDLTATVNIVTEVLENALLVPRDALDGNGPTRTALLLGGGARAVAREVRLGPCDEARCQVLSGLAEGDRVVSPLPPGLVAGARIHVK